MIFRIYPTKDTFITNAFAPSSAVRMTGSNLGGSEELDVFKLAGASGTVGVLASASLSRILMQFDLSAFTALTASGDIPSRGLTYRLRLNHKTHAGTNPESFDLNARLVSASWDEGRGKDINLGDAGTANWIKRTSTDYWTTPGGDFSGPIVTQHFDVGTEDLDVDVTNLVELWLSGSAGNYGFGIMLPAAIESDSAYTNYYQKKFYSRQTDFDDRAPYLEVRANDSIRDDRMNMQFGRTGSLFLYNLVGGSFQDLPGGQIIATISDASGVLARVTASHGPTGIYSASFALPAGSYSGSVFYDSWGSGSFAFTTGSFTIAAGGPTTGITQYPLTARVRNMQDEYAVEDVAVLEVLFRRRAHTLPVFQTASMTSAPYIVEQAYYAIENDSTRERVIPFGTGSQQHTRLSYGQGGNSFKLFMSNLHSGHVYRVIFLVTEQGRQQVIDGGFRFRVA